LIKKCVNPEKHYKTAVLRCRSEL